MSSNPNTPSPSLAGQILQRSSSSTPSLRSLHTSSNVSYPHGLPSTIPKVGTSGDPALAKRRARNLLRDYYGLADTNGTDKKPDGVPAEPSRPESATTPDLSSMDSPNFDPQACFVKLVKESSLKDTLATANRLMAEMRELDGERQSLVYNHHHELVEASTTIGKMKTSAETLDGTLDELQNSFAAISELTTALSTSSRPRQTSQPIDLSQTFDPSVHLLPLISLPTILRALTHHRPSADQLWGEWEPALRSFEEAGIEGARRIGNECREVLRQGRSKETRSNGLSPPSPLNDIPLSPKDRN
ncbi:hypothetical protein CROQUDRAFT_657463 [Cronartium quercuum f. sp. fusiforme G11]|uniref:Vacuolar protein sorting-associated protein 51 homolog n=1 Tax=Cronartium quercuum f. sp. fusiforme G11 TaxID=708437 RepID=A0A9P6NMR9_9BASI|nr:hypothetical protein CROQUDRAFT_657463 [Cronartium quercuum f. sp. fusiforme G11]